MKTTFHRYADDANMTVGYAARVIARGQRPAHPSHAEACYRLRKAVMMDHRLVNQAEFICHLEDRFPYMPEAGPKGNLP